METQAVSQFWGRVLWSVCRLVLSLHHAEGCPISWASSHAVDKCSPQNPKNQGCIWTSWQHPKSHCAIVKFYRKKENGRVWKIIMDWRIFFNTYLMTFMLDCVKNMQLLVLILEVFFFFLILFHLQVQCTFWAEHSKMKNTNSERHK